MEIVNGIWVVEDFFTVQECEDWIKFAENIGFEDAPISVGQGKEQLNQNIRNNARAMVDDENLAFEIWQRAKEHLPKMLYGRVALGLNERLRFYRYDVGQKFRLHADGSFRRPDGEESLLTFMVYLNGNFVGGETVFMNREDTVVNPETGMLLAFRHELWHEGAAVIAGRKYVLRSDVMFSK